MARKFDERAPGRVHRVLIDERTVSDIEAEILGLADRGAE